MNTEIDKLGLPRGVWQSLINKALKDTIIGGAHTECRYPDNQTVQFLIKDCWGSLISEFKLSFMHGCRGILISHYMKVMKQFQGMGIAKKLQAIKKRIAKDLQVSVLMATVKSDNSAEQKVIKDWTKIHSFDNLRTGNNVFIFVIKV